MGANRVTVEGGVEKYVVVVRNALPGEFGGRAGAAAVRMGDDWRVVSSRSAAEAVSEVLGAGEVPVHWCKWKDLPVMRRALLRIRDAVRFVRGW